MQRSHLAALCAASAAVVATALPASAREDNRLDLQYRTVGELKVVTVRKHIGQPVYGNITFEGSSKRLIHGENDGFAVYPVEPAQPGQTKTTNPLYQSNGQVGENPLHKGRVVRVATGDVDGDGTPDIITGAGQTTAGPHVKVFDGRSDNYPPLGSFFAFEPGFEGSANVGGSASAIVPGGALVPSFVVGRGQGDGPTTIAFLENKSGRLLQQFAPFGDSYRGGVRVATGDLNGDGLAEVVAVGGLASSHTGATGGHVKVFDGRTHAELSSFFLPPSHLGDISVAIGNVLGDSRKEIILGAPAGTEPIIDVLTPAGDLLQRSLMFDASFRGGVNVAVGDLNGDGQETLFAIQAIPEPAATVALVALAPLTIRRRR